METWFEIHACDDGVWNLHNQHKTKEACIEEITLLRKQYPNMDEYRVVKCEVVVNGL